jgi:hypothetical protein
MTKSTTKYRPYFTSEQLEEILRCLKTQSTNYSLIRYLETFRAKVEFGSVSCTVSTPRETLEDKLGFSISEKPVLDFNTMKELAYKKWLKDPISCSSQELARVHMYRYEKDLMSDEEEILYERGLGLDR